MKWYKWAWEFFSSTNKTNLLTAANQISKSSTMIRKCIDWATNLEKWPQLWPTKKRPYQFWYFYPSKDIASVEWYEKWVKEWMPRLEYKDDPVYGWREDVRERKIFAVYFNTGVTVYFRSYEQSLTNLQTSSVDAIFCDEELPAELYHELVARLFATDGYFHHVFTATLGQEMWRLAMEERGAHEIMKDAFKQQISMYDCMEYMDGTKSHWTAERIQQIINQCGSPEEVQRRVFGKFVRDRDRMYVSFTRSRNLIKGHPLPKHWNIFSGVDVGSGGDNHPAAIVFIAVSPDFRQGRVFRGWRGDKQVTTAGDVYRQYVDLRGNLRPVVQVFDPGSRDFGLISEAHGEYFKKADKSRDAGEQLLNSLFKSGMLKIHDDCEELFKLVIELENLRRSTLKINAKDDFIDALRYTAMSIPWDLSAISGEKPVDIEPPKVDPRNARLDYMRKLDQQGDIAETCEREIRNANELNGSEQFDDDNGYDSEWSV